MTRGQEIPEWAVEELSIASWGQFFLKYILGHEAVTVAVPGTDNPAYMLDNMGAAQGPLPDEAQRRRMVVFVESL